jgi:hypothetical protein
MSAVMEEDIKRWTARRKAASVLDIIQGKTTVAEASAGIHRFIRTAPDSSRKGFALAR